MIEPRQTACALWLALALAGCGGEQFMSAESEGAGGGGKSAGKLPPGATGGGTAVDTPPAVGGSVATVDPGDVLEPPVGNGGQPGVVGGGEAGSGNDDPGEEPASTLDLTPCGPDAFGTGIMPTLYSTLDSAVAVTDPAIGELGFVNNAEGDYHGDHCGTAININQPGDYVKYHYQDNDVRHFSPLVGTLDFWYRPSYAHTDGFNHRLFSSANWAISGGFRLRKAAADNENAFQVSVASSALEIMELSVPADQYQFSPDRWARITLVWYLSPDLPRRYVRLYLDGKPVGEVEAASSFFMAPDLNGYFVFGVWDFGDLEHAAGLLDDLKVFPRGP